MTDNAPRFVDEDAPLPPLVRGEARPRTRATPKDNSGRFAWLRVFAGVDVYLLSVVGMLLAISLMMVYSTTFDWGYQDYNNPAYFLIRHAQTMGLGLAAMVFFALVDYHLLRRVALPALLIVIGALAAVLLFGDDVFNARRSLIGGRFQPGEAAQLVTVIYMAAWLSAKRTRVQSITYGLIPFAVLVGLIGGLVLLQPDLSTTAIVFITAGVMFFLAGAKIVHLLVAGTGVIAAGLLVRAAAYLRAAAGRGLLPGLAGHHAGGLARSAVGAGVYSGRLVRRGAGRGPAEVRLLARTAHGQHFRLDWRGTGYFGRGAGAVAIRDLCL